MTSALQCPLSSSLEGSVMIRRLPDVLYFDVGMLPTGSNYQGMTGQAGTWISDKPERRIKCRLGSVHHRNAGGNLVFARYRGNPAGSPNQGMKAIQLHDRSEIEAFLRRNVFLHIYAIGDLDDFFWPYTTWYAHREGGEIRQIALLYSGSELPTLVAVSDDRLDELRELTESIMPLLPRSFCAHLSEDLSDTFARVFSVDSHGTHYKMGLMDPSRCDPMDTTGVEPLSTSDVRELETLYETAYPGHWFEPRMLETGHYYGIRRGGTLVSAGGVHVYSRAYRVAALGNIATHPDHRGEGLASKVTAGLCRSLLQSVDHVGLNVRADNEGAIACYEKLGFAPIAMYEECLLEM